MKKLLTILLFLPLSIVLYGQKQDSVYLWFSEKMFDNSKYHSTVGSQIFTLATKTLEDVDNPLFSNIKKDLILLGQFPYPCNCKYQILTPRDLVLINFEDMPIAKPTNQYYERLIDSLDIPIQRHDSAMRKLHKDIITLAIETHFKYALGKILSEPLLDIDKKLIKNMCDLLEIEYTEDMNKFYDAIIMRKKEWSY